jgi:hypothetical protein
MSLAYILLGLSWIVAVGGSFLVARPLRHRDRALFAIFFAIMLTVVGWYEGANYEKPPSAKEIALEHEIHSEPLTSTVIPVKPPDQILLHVTPDYLMDLYKDRTSIQGDKLAEDYRGKLIQISGPLGNVFGPAAGLEILD